MEDLIKALQIFLKYGNPIYPTYCSHDQLTICDIEPSEVTKDDISKLELLGFLVDEDENCFISFKFGSA